MCSPLLELPGMDWVRPGLLEERLQTGGREVRPSLQLCFIWPQWWLFPFHLLPKFQNCEISHKNRGFWLPLKRQTIWQHWTYSPVATGQLTASSDFTGPVLCCSCRWLGLVSISSSWPLLQWLQELFSKSYIVIFKYLSSYNALETCRVIVTAVEREEKLCVGGRVSSLSVRSQWCQPTHTVVSPCVCTSLRRFGEVMEEAQSFTIFSWYNQASWCIDLEINMLCYHHFEEIHVY